MKVAHISAAWSRFGVQHRSPAMANAVASATDRLRSDLMKFLTSRRSTNQIRQ